MSHPGFTLWFTGLPCSGKTSISVEVEKRLRQAGHRVERLDGDVLRKELSRDLSFSKEDREKNIERVAFVASALSRNGVIAIVSLVSPYRSMREAARKKINSFIEVYVRCPLEVCEKRDVKGMYRMAREGKIKNFTGISDPYEEPKTPDILIDSDRMSLKASVDVLFAFLEERKYVLPTNPFPEDPYLTQAFLLANKHHRGQERKGGLPYITHPISVAKKLHEAGFNSRVVAAGLLHDVLEDTGCEIEEIKEGLGAQVARWVGEVTDRDKTVSWAQRKKNYIQRLSKAPRQALAVACADKTDNLRSLVYGTQQAGEKFKKLFSTKMKDKIKNYEAIYRLIQKRYPSCGLLPAYQAELAKLKKLSL